ncbi:MAG: hypothetical protein JWO00_260 [Candidatus Parcubacteria bacterium]|nr:hypothetical protein [Candidatus Parcubacteria bacterium]
MKKSTSHTGLIVVVIVVALAAVGYFYTQGSSVPAGSTGLTATNGSGDVGLAEINLLNQIESIRMDSSLFQNPTYLSLKDYTVEIPSQNVGRPNPFAPIPGVGNPNAISTQKK